MNIPTWWEAILLALAAWRTFQLVAFDEILDWPRRKLTRLGRDWQKDGDKIPDGYRMKLAVFITCPYCAGFWIALLWWTAWQLEGHGTLVAATVFALSAGVVAGHKLLGSE